MIHFIQGTIVAKSLTDMVVDIGHVGYRVYILGSKYKSIPKIGEQIKLHTRLVLNQRDGLSDLYGFMYQDEAELFDALTSVSGVGPKTAHAIVCGANIAKLQQAIATENHTYLTEFGGIGPKIAKKIVIDLKNKVVPASTHDHGMGDEHDVMEALASLGYKRTDIKNAIAQLPDTSMTTQAKVKEVLKLLG